MLPVLQSLLVAGSGGVAQGTAACLLARMTPPAKVLPVLLQALEVRVAVWDMYWVPLQALWARDGNCLGG